MSALQQRRQPIPAGLRLRQRLAHQLVFKKLHQTVGGRLRYFVSGGAPLAQEIAEFFHAAGILILEGYGLTETCPALTGNCYDRYKFGTVGMALPWVELRLAPDGGLRHVVPILPKAITSARKPPRKYFWTMGGLPLATLEKSTMRVSAH